MEASPSAARLCLFALGLRPAAEAGLHAVACDPACCDCDGDAAGSGWEATGFDGNATGGRGEACCEVAAAGAASSSQAAADCDKAADGSLAGRLPFCLGHTLHTTLGSGGIMNVPVISFASMSLHYN